MKALTLHRESKRQTSKNSFLLRYSQIWGKTKLSLDQDVLRCFRKDRSDSPWDCGSILVYTSGKVCRGGRWCLEIKGNGNASIGGTDVFESSAVKPIVKVKLMILRDVWAPKFSDMACVFSISTFAIWTSTSWHFMASCDFTSSFLLWG